MPFPKKVSPIAKNKDLNIKRPSTKPIVIEVKTPEALTNKVKQSFKPEEIQIKKPEQETKKKKQPTLKPVE